MNKWVSEMTDGMIDEAIDYLDPELVMILMNTVLFDGKWVEPFDEELTSEDTFHNYDGSETTIPFMHSSEYYSYFELNGAVGIHKQYKDGYKFIAVLPEGDINEFIAEMDVSEIVGKTRYSDMYVVDMSVPKFDYKFKADLNEILMGMGLGKAFISSAEFNNLFSDNDRNVLISSVSQQAKIIMNEGGTKAAAYTEVDAAECEHIYVDVVLNKPFFYMIVDKDGIPLFMGTIYNFTEQ